MVNKKKYQALFENSIMAMFINRPDGTILEANKAASRMFGYSEEEFIKLGRKGVIDPNSPGLTDKLKEREETGNTSGELIGIRKTGEKFWCEFSSSVFNDPDGGKMASLVLIELFDNSERQESLKGVMNNVPGVIYRYVTESERFEKSKFLSGEVKQVLGFSPGEIFEDASLGWKNIHEDDLDRVVQSMKKSADENTKWVCEYRYNHPDGSTRWLKGMGNPVSRRGGQILWDSIVIDITEEKQAEVDFKLMESVATEANDAVLITKAEPVEAPHGPEIIYVNRGFEKMTGYRAEEVIGKTPRILQGSDTGSEQLQKLRGAVRKRKNVEVELLNYSKEGEEYWVNISLSPIFEGDECTHFISIQKDITDRKLRELQDSLSSEISRIFNREESVRKALQKSLDEISNLKLFDAVELWLVDRNQALMNLAAHTIGNSAVADLYVEGKEFNTFQKGVGLPGMTWEKKENLFWRNLDERETFIRREQAAKAGLKSAFSFHVMDEDEVIGVLILLLREDLKKERYYVNLFKELAKQFASEISRKELEEELSRIFTSAPDIICIAGLDGYYKKINPAMSVLLGYSEEELLSTPIIHTVHPLDKQKTIDEFEALNRGEGSQYFENRHITKSGRVIWLLWTTKLFYDERITYSVAKDITEEKELRELLEQANRLAKIGSWEVDLIEEKIYWSDITRKIHEEEPGFTPDLGAGINFYKEGKPREIIQKAVDEAINNGTSWDLELPIITAKGNEKWIRTIGEAEFADGKCVRIYGSFQDIHSQKVAEEKLIERTSQLDAIAMFNSLLIIENSWKDALEKSFPAFGELINCDRVYYFNNVSALDGEQTVTITHEWVREGISPQIDNPDHHDVPHTEVWDLIEPLYKGKSFNYAVKDIKNKEFRELLERQDVKSLLALPVIKGTEFEGFIGFDDCTSERVWGEEEISFLRTISINLASAIENEEAKLAVQQAFEEKNEILESIGDGFFTVDHNWTVTYWNNVAENVVGMPRDEIIGKNLWEQYEDAVSLDFYKQYHKAVKERVNVHFEEYYPALDLWLEVSAYPSDNGLSVYFKDINERKENEEKIKQINERFEKVTKATNDAIWDFDVQNGNLYWGKGFETLFGYDLDKINPTLGFLTSLIHSDDRERVTQRINLYMSDTSKTDWFEEYRFQREDGSYAYVMDRAIFIRNNSGEVTRVVGAMTDLTRQKEYEESLKKLNVELEQQAKELASSNAELEQFAFVASHDLQEPLRMITGFLAQIEKKYDDVLDEKGKKYIHFATDGAKRMREIILDLLEFSRVGRVDTEREEIDMNDLVQDAIVLNKKMIAEQKADINVERMPVINAAKAPMRQLFQNLINNAVKYQKKDSRPKVKITSNQDDDFWHFEITDNGIGINQEYSDKIFNIFQRLHGKEEYSGSGIGLAICRKIVEDHGGKIYVESEPGKGSTFYFSISKKQSVFENED